MALDQTQLLLEGQRPGRKFFQSVISTSFCPSMRSSVPIRFSYASTSSEPPKTSAPLSRNSFFPCESLTRATP